MSNRELRNYDPCLLLDFYETKLKFKSKKGRKKHKSRGANKK